MSRDRWDETLHWMTEKQGMGELPPTLRNLVLDYLAQAFPENQPPKSRRIVGATLKSLPEHDGRNETFAVCSACHSMRLVAQQGLDRDSWNETLELMTDEEGMAELPTDLHERILDYLVWAFPVQRPPASRSRFRCRPTNWGVVYGGIAGIFCLVSLHWGINLLYVSAAFLLGGALCGAAWPWLMLARLTVAWELPEHVFAREPFTATARLRNACLG